MIKLTLPAKIDPLIDDVLNQEQQMIFDLVDAFGSPLNLIFPQIIRKNIDKFQSVYNQNHLQGKIYFTSKPNKSQSIIKQACLLNVNIDVSSAGALKNALACGFQAHRIECTGPKNFEYLSLCVQQGATLNADSLTEIAQAIQIKQSINRTDKIRVFVRLSGFHSPRVKFTAQDGTFGTHIDQAPAIFDFLKTHKDHLDFIGFSYYWSGASHEQRIVALENTLELTFAAIEQGLTPKGLNIGGGFHVQYANNPDEWTRYVDDLKQSILSSAQSLTWNDNGLGFRQENGLLKGSPSFMDHAPVRTSYMDFDHIINTPLPAFDMMSAAQILRDTGLHLFIEPGRALLDQLGISIGRVNDVKKSVRGENLVMLDMNRSNMHSTHQKLLTDPIILYQDKTQNPACDDGVYYVGNLCVSYDMITYQKSFPQIMPRRGDLVIFVNTAPYIMDFIESNTLHQDIAQKISIIKENDRFRWFQDEKYNPIPFIKQKNTTGQKE
jgi:diaminopimelate decarboxylase